MNTSPIKTRSIFQRYSFVWSIAVGLACGAACAYFADIDDADTAHTPSTIEPSLVVDLKPSPQWSPSDVVSIQLEALEYAAKDTKGFECCYRFASPSNLRVVGSLKRFTQLVQEAYGSLVGSSSRLLGREVISQNDATVLVSCVGSDSSVTCYRFVLSKQQEGSNKDCWLTDSVIMITDNGPPQPGESNNQPTQDISSIN